LAAGVVRGVRVVVVATWGRYAELADEWTLSPDDVLVRALTDLSAFGESRVRDVWGLLDQRMHPSD
jgi:hypothetical protein